MISQNLNCNVEQQQLLAIVRSFLPHQKNIPDTNITISKMTGGLTNTLQKLKIDSTILSKTLNNAATNKQHNSSVIVRLYERRSPVFIDRRREALINEIVYENGFGKCTYGIFEQGRVESFIDGVSITPQQMTQPLIMENIAHKMAQLHKIKLSSDFCKRMWSDLNYNHFDIEEKNFEDKNLMLDLNNLKTLPEDFKFESTQFQTILENQMEEAQNIMETKIKFHENNSNFKSDSKENRNSVVNNNSSSSSFNKPENNNSSLVKQKNILKSENKKNADYKNLSTQFCAKRFSNELSQLKNFVTNWIEEHEKGNTSKNSIPIVLCHNDLLSGNIVYDDKLSSKSDKSTFQNGVYRCPVNKNNPSVNFIDFEYSSLNYRSFDIANFFCECCGFDCDQKKFPDFNVQSRFFKCYLAQFYEKSEIDVQKDEIEQLRKEILPFVLCSHLFQGIWAVLQTFGSAAEKGTFDYALYARRRLIDGYLEFKTKI